MAAYYNEIDPYAAQWLRNLIAAGHIADGEVDERSISDVSPVELHGFTQCHFFAGIGVWSHALRSSGWSDERPVWTGSCPCQPFSAAGKGAGFDDQRHLWPHWHHLINECRPPIVFGEQVASKDGLGWLDLVSADMEASGYAFAASDLCAAGFGGAHIRQRLYLVGMAHSQRAQEYEKQRGSAEDEGGRSSDGSGGCNASGGMAYSNFEDSCGRGIQGSAEGTGAGAGSACERPSGLREDRHAHAPMLGRHAPDWLLCRDGKWRPVEPGTFPLAHEASSRVGRLRAYGNGLDAETAKGFISSVMECI